MIIIYMNNKTTDAAITLGIFIDIFFIVFSRKVGAKVERLLWVSCQDYLQLYKSSWHDKPLSRFGLAVRR